MPEAESGYDPGYAKYIDHTVLKPETTRAVLKRFCDEAKRYGFAGVCVNPVNVRFVAEQLKGSPVKACSVVGFPLGANLPEVKASTGVNNRRLCDAFLAAGATRMGTSKGMKIVDGNDE